MTPKISVVMSLYNSSPYLEEAIDSVLSQTLSNFEFIIIDDGSQDNSVDIVRSYHDPRISLTLQENAGLPAALNKGIGMANSDLIARMDPDDICFPDRLARQYDCLLHNKGTVVVGSAATCIDDKGDILGDISPPPLVMQDNLTTPESPCVHPSVMFRLSAFEEVGGYPEDMRCGGEDAVLFNRMLSLGAIVNIPDPLIYYRLSHSSMSQKSRRFNVLLRQIVSKKVINEKINDDEWAQLTEEYRRPNSGHVGYNLYVGKLLLSGRGDESRARKYLLKALKDDPATLNVWMCLASSCIPLELRQKLYYWWKSWKA